MFIFAWEAEESIKGFVSQEKQKAGIYPYSARGEEKFYLYEIISNKVTGEVFAFKLSEMRLAKCICLCQMSDEFSIVKTLCIVKQL